MPTWLRLCALFAVFAAADISWAQNSLPPGSGEAKVVRAYFDDPRIARRAVVSMEALESEYEKGYIVLLATDEEIAVARRAGFRVVEDTSFPVVGKFAPERTLNPGQLRVDPWAFAATDAAPAAVIAGFSCYRTVENSYESARRIVDAHPELATWTAVGQSWKKENAAGGYDLMMLRLTNSAISGTKPAMFVTAMVHPREVAPVELVLRFAEELVDAYDTDADARWLLDHHELHLMPAVNPDGRKRAEMGLSWRKNHNTDHCPSMEPGLGVDLNRNFGFQWGGSGGSSGNECSKTYRGSAANSEAEAQAVKTYMDDLFPDARGPDDDDAAAADTSGIFLDIHSHGRLVLYPWGHTSDLAPNDGQLQTLARKVTFFNQHTPQQGFELYQVNGSTQGYAYGELGRASLTFELGNTFFQRCDYFESRILPRNLPALRYALKVARKPYVTPYGPDVLDFSLSAVDTDPSTMGVTAGTQVEVAATFDDTRYKPGSGQSTQTIAAGEYYLDTPHWADGSLAMAMSAVDGAFDGESESATATVDTTGLSAGRHTVFVRGKDADGNWGAPGAVFLFVGNGPPAAPAAPAVTAGTAQLAIGWTAPADNGSTITGYAVRYKITQRGGWLLAAAGTDTQTTITGLTNDMEYEVQVHAVNAVGRSAWSESSTATPNLDPVLIDFGAAQYRAVEGASASVVVRLDAAHGLAGGIDIPIEVSGGTASSSEYDVPASIRFGATDTEAVLLVATTEDTLVEADETIVIAFGSLPAGFVAGERTTTVTITDNDSAPPPPPPPPPTGGGGGGGSANRPPVIESEIEDQTLTAGDALELDIHLNFYDRDQRALDYTVESADPSVAEVEVDRHGLVTIRGVRRGVTAITVTAADRREESVSQTFVVTVGGPALVALVPQAADLMREGFVRVINHSGEGGEIAIAAIDDAGMRAGPIALTLGVGETVHFNSTDLEDGNAAKGLADGLGPAEGDWRLVLDSDLDFEVLSYIRTEDGFLTAMHDVVPLIDGAYRVAIFNPGSNPNQVSHLRLINPGTGTAEVSVEGIDDAGASPGTAVEFDVPAGRSTTLTASELEAGTGLDGALGDGIGKWRLSVMSDRPIVAMSLLSSPTGHLTNLSALPPTPDEDSGDVLPLFPAASDPLGRQGFVRVVNRADESGTVLIEAYDDSDLSYPPLTLALNAKQTRHFNSDDLELGNAGKGLTGSTGSGMGDWRLVLSSDLDVDVLAYIRTDDGFLTSMHDVAPALLGERRVAIFNPGSNPNQVSRLRLVNPGTEDAQVAITGVDDAGASGGSVTVTVSAGASRTIAAADLEAGGEGFAGSLGDGEGKWRLAVTSEQPVIVMSLLSSPTGHLTNLSTAPDRGGR